MSCGMAKMMRNATVARLCGDVPAYHMSTRLVGISIAGIRHGPPFRALHADRRTQNVRAWAAPNT